MSELLYQVSTAVFGHSKIINYIRNRCSDHHIIVDPSASIGRGTSFFGDVEIGPNVSITWYCDLRGDIQIRKGTNLNGRNKIIGDISIGRFCAIAPRARIRTTSHPTHRPSMQSEFNDMLGISTKSRDLGEPVTIGNDVWICADAKILSGVTVGDGAIIAANSVVVNDVEPYSFVAGNPAEHKKYRFDTHTREQLLELEWWNWTEEKIRKNEEFFKTDLRSTTDFDSIVTDI